MRGYENGMSRRKDAVNHFARAVALIGLFEFGFKTLDSKVFLRMKGFSLLPNEPSTDVMCISTQLGST